MDVKKRLLLNFLCSFKRVFKVILSNKGLNFCENQLLCNICVWVSTRLLNSESWHRYRSRKTFSNDRGLLLLFKFFVCSLLFCKSSLLIFNVFLLKFLLFFLKQLFFLSIDLLFLLHDYIFWHLILVLRLRKHIRNYHRSHWDCLLARLNSTGNRRLFPSRVSSIMVKRLVDPKFISHWGLKSARMWDRSYAFW